MEKPTDESSCEMLSTARAFCQLDFKVNLSLAFNRTRILPCKWVGGILGSRDCLCPDSREALLWPRPGGVGEAYANQLRHRGRFPPPARHGPTGGRGVAGAHPGDPHRRRPLPGRGGGDNPPPGAVA